MLDATVDTFRSTLEFAVESQKGKGEIFVAVPAVGADAVVKIKTSFLKAMLESNQESVINRGVTTNAHPSPILRGKLHS
jgi:hypothetical protein